jgi:outer membrane protein assembly factor BamB
VTLALDARTGRRVWSFPSSEYANPVVADSRRVYLTGQKTLFAMAPQRGHHHRRGQHHRRGRHRRKR